MTNDKSLTDRNPGRPPLWKDPKALEAQIEAYRSECEEKKKPFTITGLAIALGCDRRTLVNYAEKDEFFPSIKKARSYAEAYIEEYLLSGRPPIGAIFVAKNNFGWKDKSEIDVEHKFMMIDLLRILDQNPDVVEGETIDEKV